MPSERLAVLVVTNMWPADDDPSAGVFVAEQVADLRADGFDVDVVHFDGRSSNREYARAVRTVTHARRRRRYDVVHAHYGLTGFAALLARARPLVTTFHGSDTGFKQWQLPISKIVARRSRPVVVDPTAAQRLGVQRAAVIPMGVDVDVFRPPDQRQSDSGTPLVVFPGSPDKRVKNHPLFVQVVDELRRRGVEVSTTTLVRLTRPEVARTLGTADVVLMTSLFEGSPVTVREALACGTPVVSVRVGDVPGVLEGLPGCACVERTPTALADAVEEALAAARDRDTLRQAVVGVSDRSSVAEKIGALYRAVAAGEA